MRGVATDVQSVWTALEDVYDPEIPNLSLVDLGMVYDVSVTSRPEVSVAVQLLPTFVGCPALEFIKARVVHRIRELDGVETVSCSFIMEEPWTTERISQAGRRKLEEFGIAPPPHSLHGREIPSCPYCKAETTEIVSLFGPTACRAIFYCKHCQQPFEGMKYI